MRAEQGSYQLQHLPDDLIVHAVVDQGDFQLLLSRLHWIITTGRTTLKLPFHSYVLGTDSRARILYGTQRANRA